MQDTPLSGGTDTVFPSSGSDAFMMNLEQNSDGTLPAYAVVQIGPTAISTSSTGGGMDPGPGAGGGRP